MIMSEIFQLPQLACSLVETLQSGPWPTLICSTTVNTALLAAVLLGAIRLLGPVRPGKRSQGQGRES